MKKLNLGCGLDKDGIGIDCHDYGQKYVLDMEKDILPFKDGSIDEIKSNHSMEHLRDVRHILNECWRVLKKDGKLEVVAPWGLWNGAQKPVHYQCITDCWFDFLRNEKCANYGYKQWKINTMETRKNKNGEIYEIYCSLTPEHK